MRSWARAIPSRTTSVAAALKNAFEFIQLFYFRNRQQIITLNNNNRQMIFFIGVWHLYFERLRSILNLDWMQRRRRHRPWMTDEEWQMTWHDIYFSRHGLHLNFWIACELKNRKHISFGSIWRNYFWDICAMLFILVKEFMHSNMSLMRGDENAHMLSNNILAWSISTAAVSASAAMSVRNSRTTSVATEKKRQIKGDYLKPWKFFKRRKIKAKERLNVCCQWYVYQMRYSKYYEQTYTHDINWRQSIQRGEMCIHTNEFVQNITKYDNLNGKPMHWAHVDANIRLDCSELSTRLQSWFAIWIDVYRNILNESIFVCATHENNERRKRRNGAFSVVERMGIQLMS